MKKNTAAGSMSSLPEEIHVDIFLKLPLKSIGICRCVCKVWNSLLVNPKFIKMHLSHTTRDINNRRRMVRCYENKKRVFCSIDYALTYSSTLSASSTICTCHGTILKGYPFKEALDKSRIKFRVLGSCDGLLFVGTSSKRRGFSEADNLCIWNPSTGEYNNARLPQCNFTDESTRYGFFNDNIVDTYKIFGISQNKNAGCYQVKVYTVGSESWETVLSEYKFRGLKIYYYRIWNGAIYCLGFKTINGVSSKVIVYFDMRRKKFFDLLFPEEANPTSNENLKLHHIVDVMNDCLHIVTYFPSVPNRIDVWKMQYYGVRESWTKLFSLTTNLITDFKHIRLEWAFASGEVLMGSYKNKFLYDPKNDRIKVFQIDGIDFSKFRSTEYVESLVSVNSGTYVCGKQKIDQFLCTLIRYSATFCS